MCNEEITVAILEKAIAEESPNVKKGSYFNNLLGRNESPQASRDSMGRGNNIAPVHLENSSQQLNFS